MDWEAAIGRQGEALTRILVALAAMAGLLVVAQGRIPRSVYRAVLGPLRAAQAAALPFADAAPASPSDYPAPGREAAALLRRRFAALARAIANLIRKLLTPQPRVNAEPGRDIAEALIHPHSSVALAPDTS